MEVSDAKKLKALESENTKLKLLLVDTLPGGAMITTISDHTPLMAERYPQPRAERLSCVGAPRTARSTRTKLRVNWQQDSHNRRRASGEQVIFSSENRFLAISITFTYS